MSIAPQPQVLIINDNAESARVLAEGFTAEGYACEIAPTGADALQAAERLPRDVVICDVRMLHGEGGMELLDRLQELHPALPVVLVRAGSGATTRVVEALEHGALQAPMMHPDLPRLRAIVLDAAKADESGPSLVLLAAEEPGLELEQNSPAMHSLLDLISRVALASTPVLILGESGTGKERVARAIHSSGLRRNRPFVAVNTSALPEHLLESEMFGHARGAFTGATQTRKGLFVEAEGGTLLLDEIGDMPPSLQAKLLRVLQFGEVRPVGSDRVTTVNVRIIAATHRDLASMVRENRFREDLYFRLNVLPLVVPPLRERRQDIPALATHFLEETRLRMPKSPVRSVSPEAMHLLVNASWPGNVRELQNIIERLVVLGRKETIEPRDLLGLEREAPPGSAATLVPPQEAWTLKQMNDYYVARILEQTHGDKEAAAAILGIDLSTLYRWERAKRSAAPAPT